MAQTSKTATDQANDVAQDVADNVKSITQRGAQKTQQVVEAAGEAQRDLAEHALGNSTELGSVVVDLLKAQTDHNLKVMNALYGSVDWDQVMKAVDWKSVAQIQSDFMRQSWARAAEFSQRYFEVSQSMMNSTASVVQRQARKAG